MLQLLACNICLTINSAGAQRNISASNRVDGCALLTDPLLALTILPDALLCFAFAVGEEALTMLLAINPVTRVLLAIGPRVDTVARLLIVLIVTFVHATIGPPVCTLTVQLRLLPRALIMATVRPDELSVAINLVVTPATLVDALIGELEFAVTVLHAVEELACVDGAVLELLSTGTILQVVLPETVVFLTVSVDVCAESIGLAVHEFALVLVTVRVLNESNTVSHAITPVTFILRAVAPRLLAAAVLNELGSGALGGAIDARYSFIRLHFSQLTRVEDVLAECVVRLVHGRRLVDSFDIERLGDLNALAMVLEAGNEALS